MSSILNECRRPGRMYGDLGREGERERGNQGGSPLVEVVVVDDDKKQHLAAIKMKNFAHTADHTSWTGFYSRIK